MVDIVTGLRLVGGVVLLLANGFFVTTEFAMTRVPQFPESEFTGHRGLERAWAMTDRLEIYLSGCQVGITVSSVGLGVVAEPAVTAVLDAGLVAAGLAASGAAGHTTVSVVVSLALINLLHVIIGEQAPTYLGVERTRLVAKYCAPVLYLWTKLMGPVIAVADWTAKGLLGLFGVTITRSWQEAEEGEALDRRAVRREMGELLSRGEVSADRQEEVLNALEIGERPVSEVMVPREEMITLSTADPIGESLDTIRENPQHVRFPLVGDSLDDVEGFVYIATVLRTLDRLEAGDRTLADIAVSPTSVSTDTPISRVIDTLQAENQEIAFVTEDGEVVGLVTISDAFEAIAGQVEDPLDLGAET